MIDTKTIADPHTHYGASRAETRNFLTQRITGALNIAFLLFLVWFVVRLAGAGRAEMVAVVGNPIVAIVLCLLIINVCLHMRIGMREVIEDYVHDPRTNRLSLMLNSVFAIVVAIATIIAVGRIVFWG